MRFRIWSKWDERARRSAARSPARSRHHRAAHSIRAARWPTRAAGRKSPRIRWLARSRWHATRWRKDAMPDDEPKSSPLRAVVGLGLIVALVLVVLFVM